MMNLNFEAKELKLDMKGRHADKIDMVRINIILNPLGPCLENFSMSYGVLNFIILQEVLFEYPLLFHQHSELNMLNWH